jgi:hypothetical protein
MGFRVEQNKMGGIEHICQALRDYCPGIVHKLIIHSVEYIAYSRSIAVSLNLGHILKAIVYTMWGGGFFEKHICSVVCREWVLGSSVSPGGGISGAAPGFQ